MDDKTNVEKLRVLLPHWVEHNKNHEAEFRKWAAGVRAEGNGALALILDQAAASMAATDGILKRALQEMGGAAEVPHHHHHQHHYD